MTQLAATTRAIVIERVIPHAPQKIWRALTQQPLIEAWLMKNDFQPIVGHRFTFRATPVPGWNGVTDCEVLAAEPYERLVYSWNASGDQAANGLKSVVTWTLKPVEGGTHVRMEHSGFRADDSDGYGAMSGGWPKIVAGLDRVAAGLG
ncbi:MAG: SRPBCC domain-containing protein [Pseudomonadota bacterium]